VDDIRVILANCECLEAIVGFDYQVSIEAEKVSNYLENGFIIFDE
jgi:hypothetical protein